MIIRLSKKEDILETKVFPKYVFVTKINKEIVCWCSIILKTNFLYIESIFTKEEYRKKGYSKNMINFIIEFAEKEGYDKVRLHCCESVIDFWEKFGFILMDDNSESPWFKMELILK